MIESPLVGRWEVNTFSNSSGGRMNLRKATMTSDNTVYAQLDLDVGPEWVRETAYDMGITSELNAYPAEGIGGLETGVTPLEMSNAYATLAGGGVHHEPNSISKVVFPDGETVTLSSGESRASVQRRSGRRGDRHPAGQRRRRDRHQGEDRLSAGRQDRHHRQLPRRLVRRLHAGALDLGLGRLPGRAALDADRVQRGSVAGGSYPAQIWGDYMALGQG